MNFIAVRPLKDHLVNGKKAPKVANQISTIIKRSENFLFLPANPESKIDIPLVANFNLVYTFEIKDTPSADKKVLQLSSPFCEHAFQKFSRYFYTVGFDDSAIKSDTYIEQLASAKNVSEPSSI